MLNNTKNQDKGLGIYFLGSYLKKRVRYDL